jgi:gliding motility-associated-like protein
MMLMRRMMSILILTLLTCTTVWARHIRGGEMFYKYERRGPNPNESVYTVTVKLYIDCTQQNPGQLDNSIPISVYQKPGNNLFGSVFTANLSGSEFIRYDPNSNPCIVNPPTDVCYNLRFYTVEVTLPDSPDGYTLSYQRCCRLDNIVNVIGSGSMGATYSCEIPGTNRGPLAPRNSSVRLNGNDAVAICAGTPFTFDFSGLDPDGDSLSYTLCDAFVGGGLSQNGNCFTCVSPNPASPPPYTSVPYTGGFAGIAPMGPDANINPRTGLITGIAPPAGGTGQYVVTVCVSEFKNGQLINVHRKDIHLKVSDCNPLRALLNPDYAYCDDFLVNFQNEQVNPPGTIFVWNFGDNTPADTSTAPDGFLQHQYADTGVYVVKLKAILAGQCVDSATTLAKVFPGFFPGFTTLGSCVLNAIQFFDTTRTTYGAPSKWRWTFGDETTLADTSQLRNPSWKYNSTGQKRVELYVESNKGCRDTLSRLIDVKDKPIVTLGFRDTLICSIDTLTLQASGLGTYSWTPNTNILFPNTATPLVYPKTTTTYVVTLDEFGCVNQDSVRVRVVDDVTLNAGPDTTICRTDAVILRPTGDGLQFTWTPAATLSNPNVKNPVARPTSTTTYTVTARIGKCDESDQVTITTIPYPGAQAGQDPTICFGDTVQLNGQIQGSSFNWSPPNFLLNSNTLTPLAFPRRTTSYVLTVFDTLGCPKPGRDTIVVIVQPQIFANAGRDTSVVVGQPLQLNGSGASLYLWEPSTGLNRNDIANPVATLNNSITYSLKAYTPEGCFDYDTISIRVFTTQPDIFVPNAFTPGKLNNNRFKPIPVGISTIQYFRVYNRWGQLVFSSNDPNRGWDGTFGGQEQGADTYVWMVQGTDFTGKVITKKGTMILIR